MWLIYNASGTAFQGYYDTTFLLVFIDEETKEFYGMRIPFEALWNHPDFERFTVKTCKGML